MGKMRKYIKMGLLATTASLLIVSGCTQKEETAKKIGKNEPTKQTTKESKEDFETRMAGGKLGSESIAFVGGGASNKLWVIDAKYHKMVTTIDVGGPKLERTQQFYPNLHDTHAVTFTKDFKLMFTVDWFSYDDVSYAIAYDPTTFKELWRVPVGKGGHHSALSPDDQYLYVANQHDNTISVIDVKAKKKIKDIASGKGTDYISPSMYWEGKVIDSPNLFVSIDGEDKVAVLDWKKNEIIKNIPVGGKLHGVNLTPDAKQVWVAVGGAKKVVVIDAKTLEITKEIPFEGGPIHISFTPDGKSALVTSGGNQISKLDTKSYKVLWKSTGTTIPAHTGVSPDGKELWTLNHGMDSKRYGYQLGGEVVSGVQVWNIENGELITEIPAEGIPHEIQFVPYSALNGENNLTAEEVHAQGTHSVAEAGEKLFKKNCASCHGENLEGKAGPSLKTIGAQKSMDEILKTIKNGKGMMPSGLVAESEAKILANWLAEKKGHSEGGSH
jgi:YVTN family beta-propeller protein